MLQVGSGSGSVEKITGSGSGGPKITGSGSSSLVLSKFSLSASQGGLRADLALALVKNENLRQIARRYLGQGHIFSRIF